MTMESFTPLANSEAEVVAFKMQLQPGRAADYRQRHEAIWPELADALRKAGVIEYRIFLDPQTDILFAVMKRTKSNSLAALRESELNRKWWAMMSDIMETNADLSPVEGALIPMFVLL